RLRRRLDDVAVAPGQHDRCAFPGEFTRDGEAAPAAASCDDGYLAGQSEIHSSSPIQAAAPAAGSILLPQRFRGPVLRCPRLRHINWFAAIPAIAASGA